MTRSKGMALGFYLVAIAAGAAAGVTVDRWVLRERLVNDWADPRAMRAKLADDLSMTASQRAQLDTILDTRNRRFDELMDPMRPRLDSVTVSARQQIRELLTPEQQTIYDKMQREREAQRQQEKEAMKAKVKALVHSVTHAVTLAAMVTLVALVAPRALQAQADARPITLDEAVRLARRNAPAAVQARNQIRSTAATVRSRYGSFLPTLSFGGGAQTQQGQRYSTDLDSIIRQDAPWRANHSLSSNLEVFSGGRRYFDLMTARANVDAAEATEVSQSFAIARDVKQQYFAVLAAREQQAAAKVQLEQAQQQLRAAVARVAAGAATMSDSLRSIIQVGNARLAQLNAENALATANASLSRLVGSVAFVTAAASDTATVAQISLNDTQLYELVEQGPAVKQSQAQLAAAKQGKRSSFSPYLPTLSLGLSQSYTATEDGFGFLGDGRNKNLSTNVRVSFPLFNGLSREQTVVTARIAEENAEATLRDARLNARQQMVTQLGAFRTAEARVEIQRQSVLAGEEDLRVQQERYNLGAGTLLDLMTSQSTLITARQALIQARLDARTAKAQIEALVGRDL